MHSMTNEEGAKQCEVLPFYVPGFFGNVAKIILRREEAVRIISLCCELKQ
jgi:hypothetical protein